MDFDLTPSQNEMREKVRALAGGELADSLAALAEGGARANQSTRQCLAALGRAGYLGLGLNGGDDFSLLTAQEALGAASPSLLLIAEISARIFGRLVEKYGSDAAKAEILGGITDGSLMGAVALTEDGMSLAGGLAATAEKTGSGYKLSGHKPRVLGAPLADWLAVAAMCDGEPGFFLVRAGSAGLGLGEAQATVNHKGAPVAAVQLDGVEVAADMAMTGGAALLAQARAWEDQVLVASTLGVLQRAYGGALAHAKSHSSGGKPIIKYQEVGFKLAEMLTYVQSSQLLAYRVAWMRDQGDREAASVGDCAKVYCAESAEKVSSDAMQIMGVAGMTAGNPVEEAYRDAKYLQIAGTSTELSRVRIGDDILERF